MTDVAKRLADTGKWHIDTAALSIRAGHKCEYCDLDFLASVENYKSFQVDHIVPTSKGGADTDENKAISCRTCNVDLKSRWNPLDASPGGDREALIMAVREYIQSRQSTVLKEVLEMRAIIYGHIYNKE